MCIIYVLTVWIVQYMTRITDALQEIVDLANHINTSPKICTKAVMTAEKQRLQETISNSNHTLELRWLKFHQEIRSQTRAP